MPNPKIDLSKIPFYIKLGSDLIHAGTATYDELKALSANNGADDAQLAKLDAAYGDRIAREQAIADGK
jgi:hypothetical protein